MAAKDPTRRTRSRGTDPTRLAGLVFLCSLSPLSYAGQFHYGLGRSGNLKARVPKPPQIRIGRINFAIDVKDGTAMAAAEAAVIAATQPPAPATYTPPDPTAPATQLQAALDQAFRNSFTIVQSNGEASLRVAITRYTPAESRIDALTQKTKAPVLNPDGTPQVDPQTGMPISVDKTIAVEQWSARGVLAVRVEVIDASGVLLEGFAPQSTVRGSQVISVDHQDRVDRTQIPTHDQIRDKLIAELVAQFVPRYCPAPTETDVPLAVDEELRPGNNLAKEGDFQAAVKSWQSAVMKKPDDENEADRVHNLGALYEAEGYDRLLRRADPAEVEKHLAKAAQQYKLALEKDPKEKNLTRAAERVAKAQKLVDAFKDLEQRRQRALTAKANPSAWPPGSPAVSNRLPNPNPAVDPVPTNPVVATTTPTQPPVEPYPPAPTNLVADADTQEALDNALKDPRPDSPAEDTSVNSCGSASVRPPPLPASSSNNSRPPDRLPTASPLCNPSACFFRKLVTGQRSSPNWASIATHSPPSRKTGRFLPMSVSRCERSRKTLA